MTGAPATQPWMAEVAPVGRPPEQARATYDRLAPVYDLLEEPFERRARMRGLALLAARPGERLLEIGPGTGHTLVTLARQVGPAGQVTGADLSGGMLERCSRRVARAGVAPRVRLVQGDAHRLPMRDDCFDGVVMSFVLELVGTGQIPVVLDECRRVLRPGGRLVLVSLALTRPPGLMAALYLRAHRRWPQVLDCRPIPLAALLAASDWHTQAAARLSLSGLPVAAVRAVPAPPV